MNLNQLLSWWHETNPLPTAEELRARLWENWSRFIWQASGDWPECPANADNVFREVFADVSAEQTIAVQERRGIQGGPPQFRRRPRVVPQAGLEQQVAEFSRLYESTHTVESEEGEEFEVVSRTTTARKRGSTLKQDPVYVWGLQSSKPYGGEVITYEVRLNQDGTTSCNCPGWRFAKNGVRTCKHVRHVEEEAKKFFKMFKDGEQLPTVVPTQEQQEKLKSSPKTAQSGFGRVIDF